MCRRIGQIHILFVGCSVQSHGRGRLSRTEEVTDGLQLYKNSPYDEVQFRNALTLSKKRFRGGVSDQEAVDKITTQRKNETHRPRHLLGDPLFPSNIFCSAGITAILAFLLFQVPIPLEEREPD